MSRATLPAWANFLAYQAVWFISVYSAGSERSWPGVLAALLFACMQLTASKQRAADMRLVLVAVVLGAALDGTLSTTDLIRYRSSSWALPPGGAPLWILALWAAFALTLNHSMRWLRGHPVLAAIVGAIAAPLAYASAANLTAALTFIAPTWRAEVCLAVGWAGALSVLAHLATSTPSRRV